MSHRVVLNRSDLPDRWPVGLHASRPGDHSFQNEGGVGGFHSASGFDLCEHQVHRVPPPLVAPLTCC